MTRKLDLLVVAPSAKDLYQELATDFSAKEPNIWAGLLANSARNSGYGVALYDMEIERPSEKEFADIVEQHDPRLILFVVTGQVRGCVVRREPPRPTSPLQNRFRRPPYQRAPAGDLGKPHVY